VWADSPLAPGLPHAERSRFGRAAAAAAELPTAPTGTPFIAPPPSEFHRFTLIPRCQKRVFADEYLGRFRDAPTARLLLIDPHILRSQRDAKALESFLRQFKPANGCAVRVKAASPRQDRDRSRTDYSPREQDLKVEELNKLAAARGYSLSVNRPNAVLQEHDRIILWHVKQSGGDALYRVLLGQGLIGFEGWCDRRSEGVYYRIPLAEFDKEWNGWAS